MTCRTIHLGDGSKAILCDRSRRTKKCRACGGYGEEKLCDFDVGGGKTCDAKCCSLCAAHVGRDRDYCSKHKGANVDKPTTAEGIAEEDAARERAHQAPKRKLKLKPDPVHEVAGRVATAIADALLDAPAAPAKKIDATWLSGVDATVKAALVDDRRAVVAYYRDVIAKLMNSIGADAGECKSCRAPLFWIVTKNGKKAPIDRDGLNHFGSCPNAQAHRP